MEYTKKSFFVVIISILLLALTTRAEQRYEINFPDILGYKTLKCDFHMHTVFSDGVVWPIVRVDEAWRQGLDAIALSDHIEYIRFKDDIPKNLGRSHEVCERYAKERNILLIRSTEITRGTPPGHFNALFLNDVKPLETKEFLDVIKIANEQKAFVFWNHPGWQGRDLGNWRDVHTQMYNNKWLHGLEIANTKTYYQYVHQWAIDKKLTIVGNSDIHGPSLLVKSSAEDHRTMTLVFAKKRTVEGIKEALIARRTAVWYQNKLIGDKKYLDAIFKACVTTEPSYHQDGKNIWVKAYNNSDITIDLKRTGTMGPSSITLAARSSEIIKIKLKTDKKNFGIGYIARNFLIEPDKSLSVEFNIVIAQ